MLFNSLIFLFLFFPLVFLGHLVWLRVGNSALVLGWLTLASLVFYGAWNPVYVVFLIAHASVNLILARYLPDRRLLILGIVFNLGVLALFKYADFFIGVTNDITGMQWPALGWILPLGISFFTFTQLAYLIDVQRGFEVDRSPIRYLLFVTWFPHLIAGPIIHHGRVMPQFDRAMQGMPMSSDVAAGLSLFILGLSKKVLIADSLAPFVNPVFDAAAAGIPISPVAAWSGTLAYTLQLYFDFSGYSDMACGLSLLFGVRLPLNFASPYRSAGISEFWRRWHISLSTFLREYLYIPLGGNRKGMPRTVLALAVTMLLGGLWHGANWTFVLWGAVHGLWLIAERLLQVKRARVPQIPLIRMSAVALTFMGVSLSWVLFRSADVSAAAQLYAALFGQSTLSWPEAGKATMLTWNLFWGGQPVTLDHIERGAAGWWIILGLGVVWFLPSTAQMFGPGVHDDGTPGPSPAAMTLGWRPTVGWACVLAALALACLLSMDRPSPFLYFQF